MAKKTIKKSTKKPSKPSKPVRKAAPKAKAAPKKGAVKPPVRKKKSAPSKAAPAPKVVDASKLEAKLLGEINSLKGTIVKLNETVAKAKAAASSKGRSSDDILTGVTLKKSDWRTQYHAASVEDPSGWYPMLQHKHNKKTDEVTVVEGNLIIGDGNCLPAMPRDSDVGGKGAEMRGFDLIAVHFRRNEAQDEFLGSPVYLKQDEFEELLWAEPSE